MTESSSKKKEKMLISIILLILGIILIIFLLLQFSNKEYIVKFDSNGGTPVESIKVKENKTIKKPTDPTKEGYTFAGWYYNDKLFDFSTKITKDMTLEAYWSEDSIVLGTKNVSLLVGTEKLIEILSLPDGVKKEDLIYSSSDEEIATVDENGNIKAIKEGKVTITIKTKDGKYTNKIEVNVTSEEVDIETFSIFGFSSVAVGETVRLGISYEPDNATNTHIKWTSSDPNIATIDANGIVTGVAEGTVTITAETDNGKTATYTISVYVYTPSTPSDPTPSTPTDPTPSTPTDPTPSEPEVKDPVYVIYLTARNLGSGGLNLGAVQYDFAVTKDGVAFDGWLGFEYNGTKVAKSSGSASSTVAAAGNGTGKLTLTDGTVVNASVVVN